MTVVGGGEAAGVGDGGRCAAGGGAAAGALLSSPLLFSWDPTAVGEGVSFDELHQRLIHRHSGGFSTADLLDEGGTPDGLLVRCDLPDLRSVRFSPGGMHFAYLRGPRTVGVAETEFPAREPISFSFKWAKSDFEVLDFLWLAPAPNQGDAATELAVVTTQGIEVFKLSFDQGHTRSQKAFPASIRLCWVEPVSGMVLICIGARTLQPFDLRAKSPKMSKFDLVLEADQMIKPEDVSVLPIYDSTYCIHADGVNSRVSLRNVSNPSQGTPDNDIVIDVAYDDRAVGPLRLSTVDNLLIVHCLERHVSIVFDIKHRDGAHVPWICAPRPLANCAQGCEQSSWSRWKFLSGNTVVVPEAGRVFRLRVDMGAVLSDFRTRVPNDLVAVVRLLLGRTRCRQHVVGALRRALHAKPSLNDWAQAFGVLNQAYRRAIEAISQRNAAAQAGRQTTVSLHELETLISHESILSENHMVSLVFHPHFLEVTGAEATAAGALEDGQARRLVGAGAATSAGSPPPVADRWKIPLQPLAAKAHSAGADGLPGRSPYLLAVVVAYLRSLLGMQILPHKILQCFVFDICMYFQQEHTLQQLVHHHVLLDSPELVGRLQDVALSRSSAWATQACLDMALRVREYGVVAEVLLHTRQYLDLVPFLINQREPVFKLRRLLEQLEGDEVARQEDPDMLGHVVAEIYAWQAEAAVPTVAGTEEDQIAPPDLEGCERFFPKLFAGAGAAGVGSPGFPPREAGALFS